MLAFVMALSACQAALSADVGRINSLVNRLSSNPADGGARNEIESICIRAGRPGADAERAAVCTAILAKLGPQTPLEARVWLLRQLERVGGPEVVVGLLQLLNSREPRVRECARRALETNPSPVAGKALRKALARAKDDEWRVGLINSLGARRDEASAEDLVEILGESLKGGSKRGDYSVAIAAAAALGRIGGPDAEKALSKARARGAVEFRRVATDAYLSCADRFLAEGYFREATNIYKKLYSPRESTLVRIAAMQGIVAVKTAMASGKVAKRTRRKTSSRRPPARQAPKKPTVDPAVVADWDAKLRAKVEKAVKAGKKPDFFLESMRTRMKVVGVEIDGTLNVSSRGMQLGVSMSRLKTSDKKNLAAAVAGGDAEAYAIAAFYALASGDKTGAGMYLRKAGAAAEGVQKLFE